VIAQGGVVASFTASTCLRCGLANDVVWYDEDDAVTDQVVACSLQQAQVDPRRIHAIGFSSGALHSMHLALARSSYIASVVSYSGGVPAGSLEPQDPTNKVPSLLAYGREGVDNAFIDFNISSRDWYNRFASQGYYILLCDHQGGHAIPEEVVPHALRFFLDHPYRVTPEPYRETIPPAYPSFCKNGPP
jgi:predicted esterase